MSPAPSAASYTLVCGTLRPAPAGAAADMADVLIGLPQSMQNREPSSLRRPQWAQTVTGRRAST